jgi:hypothetical protein
VGSIDKALRGGTPTRRVAREFQVGRNVISRHLRDGHVAEEVRDGVVPPLTESGDHRAEALGVLERVQASQAAPNVVLASLEGVRRALSHELKASRSPSEAHIDALRNNLLDSWSIFERVRSASGSTFIQLRALAGVRGALEELAKARAALPPDTISVEVYAVGQSGVPYEWPKADVFSFYGLPEHLEGRADTVRVSLAWAPQWPLVELFQDGEVIYAQRRPPGRQ